MPAPPPIPLLDVDGVLNAAQLDLPEDWRRGTFNGFLLSWDPTVTGLTHEQFDEIQAWL